MMDLYESRDRIEYRKAMENFYRKRLQYLWERGIIQKGWFTTEDGNHIYIDGSGNAHYGAEAYSSYSAETNSSDIDGNASYGNTSTRSEHLDRMTRENAIEQIMIDTGASKEVAEKMYTAAYDYCDMWYVKMRLAAYYTNEDELRNHFDKDKTLSEAEKERRFEAILGMRESAETLENFLRDSPKWGYSGEPLYRGVFASTEQLNEWKKAFKDGTAIDQKGMSSWSTDQKVGESFTKKNGDRSDGKSEAVVFTTNGTNYGTSVAHISSLREKEVVISREARWQITDIRTGYAVDYNDKEYSYTIIECVERSNNDG